MLKGIAPCISPELLKTLAEMGHGDEIVLADAHFPGHGVNSRVLRADGVQIPELLAGILALFELDAYAAPLAMMAPVEGDQLDPAVESQYLEVVRRFSPATKSIMRLERFAFYERASRCFAVVITGDVTKYGNLLLKKGVTPSEA